MNDRRSLTSTIDESARFVILMRAPVTLVGHLLHAWAALEAFDRGERPPQSLAYAERRHHAALFIAPTVEQAISAAGEIAALGSAIRTRKES